MFCLTAQQIKPPAMYPSHTVLPHMKSLLSVLPLLPPSPLLRHLVQPQSLRQRFLDAQGTQHSSSYTLETLYCIVVWGSQVFLVFSVLPRLYSQRAWTWCFLEILKCLGWRQNRKSIWIKTMASPSCTRPVMPKDQGIWKKIPVEKKSLSREEYSRRVVRIRQREQSFGMATTKNQSFPFAAQARSPQPQPHSEYRRSQALAPSQPAKPLQSPRFSVSLYLRCVC